ncbi:MAG: diaminopimelate epimerase [Deltaproteobacteria bacterium]|nr:diaminopimelate epimerase [Deltaproteobacteria bacterium]
MRFAKYHGLGNDFLVVDLRTASPAEAAAAQDPANVIALCDRQFGVGGDGVLAVLPSETADARMRVLNSDGSEAEMCGNGIRCVAKELFDRGGIPHPEILIETGAGVLACRIDAAGGHAAWITVAMGAPRLLRAEIPMTGPAGERCIAQPLELPGEPARALTAVSMGNPHAITFVGSRDEAWRLAKGVGPAIERHAWFPQRTNAEFAYVRDRRAIDLVVWERGCGITLACGTGACATTVAAILTGAVDEGAPVELRLPGGSMEITVLPRFENVLMRGPAAHVFDASLEPAQLVRRPA